MTDSLDSTPAIPTEDATEPAVQAVAAAESAEIVASTEESAESGDFRSVDEQIALTLDAAVRPRPVRVAISEAQGLLCAEEVVAEHALPGFDQAAVDGYAVRSVDVQTAGQEPVQLPVVGEIPAGSRQPRRLQPGQAVRVDTGAPLPTLADAVVPTAYTDGHQAKVTITRSVPSALLRAAGR